MFPKTPALFAASVLAAPISGHVAAAGPVIAYQSGDLETYLTAVAGAEADLDAACARLAPDTPDKGRLWLRAGAKGLELAPEDEASREAAGFWTEFALGARAAAAALYGAGAEGDLANGPVLIELSGGALSIFDGAARAEGDLCDAMRRLAAAMGPGGGAPFAAARAAAAPEGGAPVPVGGSAILTLAEAPAAGAVIRGPDGVTIRRNPGDPAELTVAAAPGAAIGPSALRIYDPNDPYRPRDTVPITVLPGPDPAPGPIRDVIAPGGVYRGEIGPGGAVELTLSLQAGQRLTFTSDDQADLRVELLRADGGLVGADDDSGAGYGFRLSADLEPGAYVVKVTHCCGGGGAMTVKATAE